MTFELDDEQAMLRDASREVLRDRFSMEQVRALLDGDTDVAPELWQLGATLGWPGLALPEKYGGAGQGLIELAIVAEELGRALARGPFLSSALVGAAIVRGGSAELCSTVLPGLASGSASATWAFAEPSAPWSLDGIGTTARAVSDGFVLSGVKTAVRDAGSAWLLVTALLDGAPASFLVNRAELDVRRQTVLDLTRAFYEVRLDGVRVPASQRIECDVQRLLDDATVLGSAEALGVLDRMLEMTVEYTAMRVQFGRPIGSFQAVKHGAARMAIHAHAARAAVYYAAMAADAGDAEAPKAACVAASYISAALGEVAGVALQLHGGIGFTWEHDLHLYLRRAKVDAVLHGDAALHRERLYELERLSRLEAPTAGGAA